MYQYGVDKNHSLNNHDENLHPLLPELLPDREQAATHSL